VSDLLHTHLRRLEQAVAELEHDLGRLESWGRRLAVVLSSGGRLLAAGNGGSAAHAQHLTAELVGRYLDERVPLSAIALHADTSAYTAIVNDYGAAEGFARSVRAHGRPGDVLVAFSTSGRSVNVLRAAETARHGGLTVLAMTGRGPNPLSTASDEALCVDATTPTVQEIHQVAVHLVCEALDDHLAQSPANGHHEVRAGVR